METPDFSPKPSSDSIDEEPEPRPLDADAINRQVKEIWRLWSKRTGPGNDDLDREILRAHDEFERLCGEIRNKADTERLAQINPDVLFDLEFGRKNLGRIIDRNKLFPLQSPLENDTIT